MCNDYETRSALYDCLDGMNLLNEERLRPGWDTYFMVSLFFSPPRYLVDVTKRRTDRANCRLSQVSRATAQTV